MPAAPAPPGKPRCATCQTLLVAIADRLHCPGCESALVPSLRVGARLAGARALARPRCPVCDGAMVDAAALGATAYCASHGLWFAADEPHGFPELVMSRREIQYAWIGAFAAALGDVHRHGHRLVATSADAPPLSIDVGDEIRVRVAIPALAGAKLAVQFGDARRDDADTGDADFDRAWRVTGPEPELARLLLVAPIRALLQRTRSAGRGLETGVALALERGEVTITTLHDYDLDRALAIAELARAIARRPEAIDGELRTLALALGGAPRGSTAWTWRAGFIAGLPCGRAIATLEVGLDPRERLVTRIVADGSAPVGWGLLALRVEYRAGEPWVASAIPGYVAGGRAIVERDLVVAAKPASIELGARGEAAPHCELVWRGAPPPIEQLRAGLRLAADALGDAASQDGPYR